MRSLQLSRLLKYLCDCSIEQGADRITEYTIGTEALGRPSDFDATQDAGVRVEMHRLRRRLREYYDTEGSEDRIQIQIPLGRYAPVFVAAEEDRAEPFDNIASSELPAAAEPQPVAMPTAKPPAPIWAGRLWKVRRPWLYIAAAILIAAVILIASGWSYLRRTATPQPAAVTHAEVVERAAALPAPGLGYRVGCGRRRPWTDRLGQVWSRDEYFEGGDAAELKAQSYLAGAFDAHLFDSARTGSFSYRIPLPARTYELRLYFIEPTFGPETDAGGEGNRMMNVSVNGELRLERFDILADAGGPWIADVRVFKDVTPGPDGFVRIEFRGVTGAALVNALEFVPARPHVLNPVRILPQDNFYTDSAGNLWTPNNYSSGGRVAIHPGPVRNTRDQEIFRHERYGHFRYAIPVDRGSYSLYIYMSEEYWGPGNPGGGGVGTRIFDVLCNGVALIRNLDLFNEAGPNRAVVAAFRHLIPNSQGKLDVLFTPVHDYASVYALEVIDEAGSDVSSSERIVSGAGNSLSGIIK